MMKHLRSAAVLSATLVTMSCADPADVEPPVNTPSLEAPAPDLLSVEEQSARAAAALPIEAQPRETQQRYYQALLMTQQQSASVMQQLVSELDAQEMKVASARSANGANMSSQRSEAQRKLSEKQQRVKELEAKLATY